MLLSVLYRTQVPAVLRSGRNLHDVCVSVVPHLEVVLEPVVLLDPDLLVAGPARRFPSPDDQGSGYEVGGWNLVEDAGDVLDLLHVPSGEHAEQERVRSVG